MDWDLLRVFLAVAREGQMLAAARRLGLNHATVARRLDALEAALGTPLFDRRPAGSLLTQAGERLLPSAERIETELLGIAEATKMAGASVSGRVRIGAPDGLGTFFLAAELGKLTRIHPDLELELVPLPRTFSLTRREADLAIVLDPPAEGRLIVSRLSDYSLSVYASRTWVAENGVPIALEDLAPHVVVSGVEDYAYAASLDYGRVLERRARRVFRCAGVVGQMEAVRAGIGVGVLHDFAAHAVPDLVRLFPKVSFRRAYFLLSHPDTRHLTRIEACRQAIAASFRTNRHRFLP